jgi:hypothetical protein
MEEARALFRNTDTTEFVIVTIPTAMAVAESGRLAKVGVRHVIWWSSLAAEPRCDALLSLTLFRTSLCMTLHLHEQVDLSWTGIASRGGASERHCSQSGNVPIKRGAVETALEGLGFRPMRLHR